MTNSLALTKNNTIILAIAIIFAVILPQIFHLVGLGATFLPIQLPVFAAAFLAGPVVGVAVGVFSPFISYAISGMPTAEMLPYLTTELAVYGLVFGMLRSAKMHLFFKLLIAQAAGRAVLFAVGGDVAFAPGIILQWAIVFALCLASKKTLNP